MCTCFPVQQSMPYRLLFVVASPSTYLATDLSDTGRISCFGARKGAPAIKVLLSILNIEALTNIHFSGKRVAGTVSLGRMREYFSVDNGGPPGLWVQ